MNISLCTFFSYGGLPPKLEFELLDSFARNAGKLNPELKLTILTDTSTSKFLKARGYKCLVGNVKRETLLLDRLRAFRAFISEQAPGQLCAMLDYDTLTQVPFCNWFDDINFDCAYTLRKTSSKYPINGGVALYKNNHNALSVLDDLIREYEGLPENDKSWWGDQICLSNCFLRNLKALEIGVSNYKKSKILLLDGDIYNFTPYDGDISQKTLFNNLIIDENVNSWIDSALKKKFLIHFKGLRKHLQLQIDWQKNQSKSYYSFVKKEYDDTENYLEKNFEAALSKLKFKHKQFILNDIVIYGFLKIQENYPKQKEELQEKFISHLQATGDYRWKILGNIEFAYEVI